MKIFTVVIILAASVTPLAAQWIDHPTPGIPRTANGKPASLWLLPLFAAMIGLTVRRSGRNYPQQLYFALHVHAAWFLILTAGTLARFGRSWTATRGVIRFLFDIGRAHYDLVIDLHGQFRSALISLLSGAPVRIGFDRPRR